MKLAQLRPSGSTVIAFVAIFALISSSAVASGLGRNSVTNKSIRKNAVTGSKVRNGSLTGADIKNNSLSGQDIKESTLGTVPRASNADTVGGLAPAQLTTNDRFITGSLLLQPGEDRQVIAAGPFSVIAHCDNPPPGVFPRMRVTTTGAHGSAIVAGSVMSTDYDFNAGEIKTVNLTGSSQTATVKSNVGSFDLQDPASGTVMLGSLHPYLNFGGTNCRFAWFATVARP